MVKIKTHSASYFFLAQVKGMGQQKQQSQEWHSGEFRGNIEGYIVLISISLHTILSAFLKTVRLPLKESLAADVTGLVSWKEKHGGISLTPDQKYIMINAFHRDKEVIFNLPTSNCTSSGWKQPANTQNCPTHSRGTETSQRNEHLSFKQPVFPPLPLKILCVELLGNKKNKQTEKVPQIFIFKYFR